MSSLITKANKSRSSASQKVHAAKGQAKKGKKASATKPNRPGKITAAPKSAASKSSASKSKKAAAPKSKKSAAPVKKSVAAAKKPAAAKTARVAASSAKRGAKAVASKDVRAKAVARKADSAKAGGAKALPKKSTKAQPAARRQAARRALARGAQAAPPPPKKSPAPGTIVAVKAFEQALKTFNRHDYTGAKAAFDSVLEKYPDEADVVARARTYLSICDQRLARTPAPPRSPDALYDQGVFELNRNNIRGAIELFERALKAEPRADHIHYSLAAAHARLNNSARSLDALRRAISFRPVYRSHARRDLDFTSLRNNEEFQQLTGYGYDFNED